MKTTPLKSRSPSRRATLERQAYKLIQECSRLMYRGRCMRCFGEGHAGHHIVGRRDKMLRHKIMNVVYVCNDCHRYAESDPAGFLAFLQTRWPAIYKWHIENRNTRPETITCQALEANIADLKQLAKRLAVNNGN